MSLRLALDENLRGPLWTAIVRRNALGLGVPLDVVRVGDLPDLPLGMEDADLLVWCEAEDRLLVSLDYDTMPAHFAAHQARGRTSPGLLLIRPGRSIPEIVEALELVAHVGDPDDYRDRVAYLP